MTSSAYSLRSYSLAPYSRTPLEYISLELSSAYSLRAYSRTPYSRPLFEFGGLKLSASIITKILTTDSTTLTLTPDAKYRIFMDLANYPVTNISVSKGIKDQIWTFSVGLDGKQTINDSSLIHCKFSTTDHNDVSRMIFLGIITNNTYSLQIADKKSQFNGFDDAWFLNNQYVQSDYYHNTAGTNPATVITGLLEGTGIDAYNIKTVTEWDVTLNSRVFDFDVSASKWKAIEKICNYCRYLFIVKPGVSDSRAYFISEDDIETELDLPSPVTFTWPDQYFEDKIKIETKGDEQYNRVTVMGRDNSGAVFSKTVEHADVTNGDEYPVEHIENSGAWTTQAQVDERAQEIYDYYVAGVVTQTATLIDRMDLELYQKIYFSGFDGIAETAMRIIKIQYSISAIETGVKKRVKITFTDNEKWSALRRMYRYSDDDSIDNIETIVKQTLKELPRPQIGTVISIDGQSCDVQLEDGPTITTRCV